jgi:methyl-accepting chemotaxis protein
MKSDDPFRPVIQAFSRLETAVRESLKNQETFKGELRTIAPRLDTLVAEVREAARLVHRQSNATQAAALAMSDVAAALSLLENRVRQLRDVAADGAALPITPKDTPTKP